MVERCLAKANVAGPNPVSRSIKNSDFESEFFHIKTAENYWEFKI